MRRGGGTLFIGRGVSIETSIIPQDQKPSSDYTLTFECWRPTDNARRMATYHSFCTRHAPRHETLCLLMKTWRQWRKKKENKSSIQKYYKQKLLDILRKKCLIQQHERKKERKKRASAAVFCFVFIRHQKRPPVGQRDVVAKSHVKVGMERALYNRDKHTHTQKWIFWSRWENQRQRGSWKTSKAPRRKLLQMQELFITSPFYI